MYPHTGEKTERPVTSGSGDGSVAMLIMSCCINCAHTYLNEVACKKLSFILAIRTNGSWLLGI